MNTQDRRDAIKKLIQESTTPLSATTLAKKFSVSRQVVVTDVAILRAAQEPILATPRGYIYEKKETGITFIIACMHSQNETKDELETIVDCGGFIEDVIIEHPIYGELSGKLQIASRLDVEEFIALCKDKKAKNLSDLNEGIHFHTIRVPNEKVQQFIITKLNEKGYLYNL